ncbi:MAG: chemotaxis response regulator protein-glutamate methylesterase [Alphaproteobacteria bacterium]|nr:chemotaxis response regulator protein-glutamate methylesterase [Alphaproteobacteria bacterium SS10]
MLVDDSAVTRGLISRFLESDPQIEVIASVNDGQMAINSLKRTPVDVVVLDVEMPVMDGLTALPLLMEVDPAVKIIVLSTLTGANAVTTIRALEIGAADCMQKPSSSRELTSANNFKAELIRKVKALAISARTKGVRPSDPTRRRPRPATADKSGRDADAAAVADAGARHSKKKILLRAGTIPVPDAIAIGSSTGGPQALFEVLKPFKEGARQPIFITQHMPGTFTSILAAHIARQCGVDCLEASDGQPVLNGHVYIAPGGFHMTVESRDGEQVIVLNEDPPENFCRPAVDPMMRSLIRVYGRRLLTVILTGMGQDGLKGCEMAAEAGGGIIAQDEETSVVWGMPGAVANAGICNQVLPLPEIGPKIYKLATRLVS